MELKNRKDMNPEFMWDFTHIFPTKEAWEAAYKEAEAMTAGLAAYEGTLGESAAALKKALDAVNAAGEKLERVYLYAMLHKSGDNGDPEYQAMEARCVTLLVSYQMTTAFLTPEILSIPEETLASYMKEEGLATYRHMIEDMCRARAHTLDAARERMLAQLSDVAQTPDNSFTMLESVDMTFPTITDEEGREVTLTHGNFGVYRESSDQRVRRESFEKYFGEFKRYINTFAAMYAGSVKFDTFFASVRGHKSACEAALFSNNVPVSVYDSLVEAIHSRLGTMRQYLALRKRVLGLEELNMYDLYNPMLDSVEFKVTYEESKALVKEALKPLGEEYGKLLDKAYAEHWMDVYENKGKTTGAFSCGVHGVHPYVLLNFTDTLDDAFTMAHELGHAMHSYKSSEAQDYANHDYRILVAEVASTVNEVLLTKYLLKTETDKKRRAYILNHFLEGFRTTVFRQTLFAEFERKAHEMEQAGEPLTAQSLNKVYRELNELYYEGAIVNDLMEIEWARIPHFYNAFYVYQYATGFSSAVAIANRILETGDASDYLRFLSLGGSDYPLEELKVAGVDLTKPEAVLSALDVFQSSLDELEALLKEI
ncbi:MAG: oligoendopeptidase F [bacterium]|uniref:Oligopeptidase F n=1 Tax=uncultured bacterium IN-02 TaxID=1805580 RepID=A0A142BVK0_9BACT|nr:oligoendopeptidase F [uncultured bacterium IN-02]MDD5917491.1 oligoendopeptidase F [bacterium]